MSEMKEVESLIDPLASLGLPRASFRRLYEASGQPEREAFVQFLAEAGIIQAEKVAALRMVFRGYLQAPIEVILGPIDLRAAQRVIDGDGGPGPVEHAVEPTASRAEASSEDGLPTTPALPQTEPPETQPPEPVMRSLADTPGSSQGGRSLTADLLLTGRQPHLGQDGSRAHEKTHDASLVVASALSTKAGLPPPTESIDIIEAELVEYLDPNPPPVATVEPGFDSEVAEVRFFLEAGLREEAEDLIRSLLSRQPEHPALRDAATRLGMGGLPPGRAPQGSGLSAKLKIQTRDDHRSIERTPFMQRILRGSLTRDIYGEYLARLYGVYRRLEQSSVLMSYLAQAPWPTLRRAAALERDLKALGRELSAPNSVAFEAYLEHLDRLEYAAPWGLIGHAYCRYLGDLSGGRIVARLLEERHGFPPEALEFYAFKGDAQALAQTFRQCLDRAILDPQQTSRVITEARAAFRYNEQLVLELEPLEGARAG